MEREEEKDKERKRRREREEEKEEERGGKVMVLGRKVPIFDDFRAFATV
jgi:hypothetical protein